MDNAVFADLTGLRAVVTGASSGIGRAIALELAGGGADILVHCRRSCHLAEDVAASIRALDQASHVLVADFADETELGAVVDSTWSEFGPIDIWVNNAGVDLLTGEAASLGFQEKLCSLLDVDVCATMLLAREVGRRMREASGGAILNIGWDQAESGMAGDSGELFAAAKGAVMAFTRSLAKSLAPDVRVNCIAAGWIKTAWAETASPFWHDRVARETPLGRWGTPQEIAKLARFLVSGEASYMTGQVIRANGGAVR